MKKISVISVIIGVLMLIIGIAPFFLNFLVIPNTSSFGIIGGADFPTLKFIYIFWSGSFYHYLAFCGVAVLTIGIVLFIVSKFKKR